MADAREVLKEIQDALADKDCDVADCKATLDMAAAFIERQAAEIERLTPNPMTLEEACEVLNSEEQGDEEFAPRNGRACLYGDDPRGYVMSYTERDAVFIAQGILREEGGAA